MSDPISRLDRRRFLRLSGGVIAAGGAAGVLGACEHATKPANPRVIRLQSVITPVDSGLIPHLLTRFERQSGYAVHVSTAEDVYGAARAGKADIVISHYGHRDVHEFVLGGFGEWPRTVFQNQLALVGPPGDPARIGGLDDLVQAYRQIAARRASYVVNAIPELRYLSDIIERAAGSPPRGAWHHDPGLNGQAAVKYAAREHAYTLFGVIPFMVGQSSRHLPIVALLLSDPLLLRVMATIVVNPAKVKGINHAGALALQLHLLTPETQAEIRNYRVPGVTRGLWWPAGRNNEAALLPLAAAAPPPRPRAGAAPGPGPGNGGGNGAGRRAH